MKYGQRKKNGRTKMKLRANEKRKKEGEVVEGEEKKTRYHFQK